MTAFFEYPKAAWFGKVLPKTKIYQYTKAGVKLKQLFVDQVDQIVWQYKLAPETINLVATKSTPEIQVFQINLRRGELNEEVLRAIDKAIAFPIIFELAQTGKRKAIASYKRPNEANNTKWVVSEYFGTEWVVDDSLRKPLPSARNLGVLYDKLLSTLIPISSETEESIAKRVERMEEIRAKQREAERIMIRIAREKQFNKRVGINAELRKVTKELQRLGATTMATNEEDGYIYEKTENA